jgi:hypothetical protein
MWTDPIIEDLHAQRRAHAAEYGFDVQRLLAALHMAQDNEPSNLQTQLVLPTKRTDVRTPQQTLPRTGA